MYLHVLNSYLLTHLLTYRWPRYQMA